MGRTPSAKSNTAYSLVARPRLAFLCSALLRFARFHGDVRQRSGSIQTGFPLISRTPAVSCSNRQGCAQHQRTSPEPLSSLTLRKSGQTAMVGQPSPVCSLSFASPQNLVTSFLSGGATTMPVQVLHHGGRHLALPTFVTRWSQQCLRKSPSWLLGCCLLLRQHDRWHFAFPSETHPLLFVAP